MVKKSLFCFAFILLAMQIAFVSAVDTQITVKTLPDHEVQLTAFDLHSQSFSRLDSFKEIVGESGEVSFLFSSSKADFGIIIYVKDPEGNTVIHEKYTEKYITGTAVVLDLEPEWWKKMQEIKAEANGQTISDTQTNVSDVENQTEEVVLVINETETGDSAKITDFAVFGESGTSVLKVVVYIIAGLVIIAIIVMLVLRGMKMTKKKREEGGADDGDSKRSIKIRKLSEMKAERRETMEDYNDLIDDAETKIKDALDAIEKLRKNDKISEIKKRMVDDEKELLRLRKGE